MFSATILKVLILSKIFHCKVMAETDQKSALETSEKSKTSKVFMKKARSIKKSKWYDCH